MAEALTLIAEQGVEALTMRSLGARPGVVPGALHRHVRSKEQLQDLIVEGVLVELDCDINQARPWTEQIAVLAHRLQTILQDHPRVAGLLKIHDPLGPHPLALAEAVLAPHRRRFRPPPRRPGLLPRRRLHNRLRGQQHPHLGQRSAGDQKPASRVLPVAAR